MVSTTKSRNLILLVLYLPKKWHLKTEKQTTNFQINKTVNVNFLLFQGFSSLLLNFPLGYFFVSCGYQSLIGLRRDFDHFKRKRGVNFINIQQPFLQSMDLQWSYCGITVPLQCQNPYFEALMILIINRFRQK